MASPENQGVTEENRSQFAVSEEPDHDSNDLDQNVGDGMNIIDMRTVVLLNIIIFIICTLFIVQLWRQNRSHFSGIGFWVFNFILQTAALFLIFLRGAIPDWMSIVLANTLTFVGALLLYIGLERFVGKAGAQLHNYVLCALYIGAFVYSTFVHPDLYLRILIASVGLLIIGFQSLWLLWRRVEPGLRSLTFWVGAVFSLYCLAGVARIVEYFIGEHIGSDYFQSGAFHTLIFVAYLMLLILLTHSLVLMVNKRLHMEISTHGEVLQLAHDELEQHVADRTEDLSRINEELRKEINNRKQSEEQIIFQAKLLNAVEQSVIATDPYGKIVYLNPAAEKLYGWSEHEVLGKNVNDYFTAQEIEEKGKEILDLLMKGASWKGEFLVKNKQGKNFYAEVNDAPVLDDNGILIGIIGISSDITERKKAEEALRDAHWRLESIIEGTHVGTWERNVQTGETVFSEVWAQIIGYTLDELAPISIKTWETFVHPDDLKQSGELLERHFAGELPYYDLKCRMKHKDGHWVWVHARGRVITRTGDGKPLMMFGTHTDITERKRIEEALRESKRRYRELSMIDDLRPSPARRSEGHRRRTGRAS